MGYIIINCGWSNHGITHDFLKNSIPNSLGMAACHFGSVTSNLFNPKRLSMDAAKLSWLMTLHPAKTS